MRTPVARPLPSYKGKVASQRSLGVRVERWHSKVRAASPPFLPGQCPRSVTRQPNPLECGFAAVDGPFAVCAACWIRPLEGGKLYLHSGAPVLLHGRIMLFFSRVSIRNALSLDRPPAHGYQTEYAV